MNAPDEFQLLGTVLDQRYRIDSVVGEGGFGVVYRAQQISFDEPVAVKVLKLPHNLKRAQRSLVIENFRAEGKHLRRLSAEHASFVRAIDTGVLEPPGGEPAPYLVLEWLDGESLESDLTRRRSNGATGRPLGEVMTLLEPIADALAVAHEGKIAHRDIKPANIFLAQTSGGSKAKLLDFGVAKVMTETGTAALRAQTQGGIAGLTPQYAAPEQWNKRFGATGPWTDVYAFALVMLELLTDRAALDGDDAAQLMGATLDAGGRPTPRRRGVVVSAAVERVMERAVALYAADRFRSMSEFWDALLGASREPLGEVETLLPTSVRPFSADQPHQKTTPMPPGSAPVPLTVPAVPFHGTTVSHENTPNRSVRSSSSEAEHTRGRSGSIAAANYLGLWVGGTVLLGIASVTVLVLRSSPSPAPQDSTGVAVCDLYLTRMEACLDKMDPAAKAATEPSFKEVRDAWKAAAAQGDATKRALRASCDAALAAMPPECGEGIGIQACDDYITKMEACLGKMDPAAKAATEQSFKQTRDAWKQAAAQGGAAKDALKQGCEAAVAAIPPTCK